MCPFPPKPNAFIPYISNILRSVDLQICKFADPFVQYISNILQCVDLQICKSADPYGRYIFEYLRMCGSADLQIRGFSIVQVEKDLKERPVRIS